MPHSRTLTFFFRFVCIYGLALSAAHANINLNDLTRVDEATISVTSVYGGYNRRTGQARYDFTLTNISNETFVGHVYLAIETITSGDVTVVNVEGSSSEGVPAFVLPVDQFNPGKTLSSSILFANSSRVRFDITTAAYVPVLPPPEISITSPNNMSAC